MKQRPRAAVPFNPADDGWAIFAAPPGVRDLGCPEPWLASQARADRRRAQANQVPVVPRARATVSAALVAAAVGGPFTAAAAAHKTTTATSTTTAATVDLKRGSSGDAVRALQRALGIEADGVFGAATAAAVRAFQRERGISATGVVGPLTRDALDLKGRPRAVTRSEPSDDEPATGAEQVTASADVRAVQRALGIDADGVVGPQTRAAVRVYERSKGLPVDGEIDPDVVRALGGAAARPGGSSNAPDAAAPAGAGVQAAVKAALGQVGTPYKWGGTAPGGFDCSGLVVWAMKQAGISVPRTSFAQYGTGSPVAKSAIRAGDLVFFNTAGPGASDVGIATGPDSVVSATTRGVKVHPISDSYWGSHYVGARRIG